MGSGRRGKAGAARISGAGRGEVLGVQLYAVVLGDTRTDLGEQLCDRRAAAGGGEQGRLGRVECDAAVYLPVQHGLPQGCGTGVVGDGEGTGGWSARASRPTAVGPAIPIGTSCGFDFAAGRAKASARTASRAVRATTMAAAPGRGRGLVLGDGVLGGPGGGA